MGIIERPITDDGLVGYDKFGQLVLTQHERGHTISTFVADVRARVCTICQQGWEANAASMRDQFYWDLLRDHVHESCFVRHIGLVERAEFRRALIDARIPFAGLNPVANRYWRSPDPWSAKPWYEAAPLTGDPPTIGRVCFVLGWRKRVAHIGVDPIGGRLAWYELAEAAFRDEDVTKEFKPHGVFLHAWGTDKVREYVRRLGELAGVVRGDG